MTYYAKSPLANGKQPTVKEHLDQVAELSEQFGQSFDCSKAAQLAGQFHDFGKYSEAFQGVLAHTHHNIDHAMGGAAYLHQILAQLPPKKQFRYRSVLEAICGHHDGLVAHGELESKLDASFQSQGPIFNLAGKVSALNGTAQYQLAITEFQKDHKGYQLPILNRFLSQEPSPISSMLYTRMLFSCLVDADYSVSAMDEGPDYLERTGSHLLEPEKALEALFAYRAALRQSSTANTALNELRDQVFEQCGNAGEQSAGLFTLTAPTGVGKTLALLHFALRHCISAQKQRIIIVLPYLTLTEQNAAVYRKIMPELLEDHSQRELSDDERDLSARWSAPMIVTTSVRFFESLFADKPTDCRKLHHLANSVVVFDEAQSLPADLTTATLQAVQELCERYKMTMVFSTATQPHYAAIKGVCWKPREIIEDPARLYAALRRTQVTWRLDTRTPLEQITEEMAGQNSVCTILNLRKHARKLYKLLLNQCLPEECFFLTTDLCPEHRRQVVAEVNQRLRDGLPCRVVATQCIEAGVDFDFQTLYRALAPLDSIIQAAGRCNRNGGPGSLGQVIVFIPDEPEPLYPGNWYKSAALMTQNLSSRHEIDIHDPEHQKEYYELLFKDVTDKESLTTALEDRSFSDVANAYRLITDQGYRLIVPYDEALFEEIKAEAERTGMTAKLMNQAVGITVTVHCKEERLLDYAEAVPLPKRYGQDDRSSGYYLLRAQYHSCYLADMGFQFETDKDEITGIFC